MILHVPPTQIESDLRDCGCCQHHHQVFEGLPGQWASKRELTIVPLENYNTDFELLPSTMKQTGDGDML